MKKKKIACFSVSGVIFAILLALNITVGVMHEQIDQFVIGYKPGGSINREKGAALVEQIQQEGTVLVKNEDNVLPLDFDDVPNVNVFGWASIDWVYSGSGSGQARGNLDGSKGATKLWNILNSLDAYGIEYNTELIDMYKEFQERRYKATGYNTANDFGGGTLHSFNYEFSRLYEPKIEDYGYDILENALDFSDTAIVVIGRTSGESNDSPKVQYKKTSKSTKPDAIDTTDNDRTYLEISTEEEALLEYVAGNYENVIVLINSTNVMELGFLDKIEGIDACMVVATTGTAGALAIPKLLYGEYTPSGKLADTYAYDLSTSSTYVNTGSGIKANNNGSDTTNIYTGTANSGLYPTNHNHTNGSTDVKYSGVAYTDYAESIYVGYKWYETADAVGFWDSAKAKSQWGISNGYEDVVQYPFGYGLSYTDFEWEVVESSLENNAVVTEEDQIEIKVKVTNVGDWPGQDVVELYYTPEYKNNGIEKSAVNLMAFAKTLKVLEPGESEDVILKAKIEDMKSYDCYDSNKNGFKGYELESGNYKLTLRTDSHTVATDKIVEGEAEINLRVASDIKIENDSTTGNTVGNLFTGENTIDGVAIDGNSDGTASIKYLSRADFVNTFPYQQLANRSMDQRIRDINLYTDKMANDWDALHDTDAITTGANNGKSVYDYDTKKITELGIKLGNPNNFDDDDLWDPVLDQLSMSEMQNHVLHGYTQTRALDSINKPKTLDVDGPNQVGSFYDAINGTTGFSSITLAQSWNTELAYSMGLAIASECASNGVSGWYGPAINLHRSPFGGRNYEYYSEDTLISGLMSARTVEAAKNGGVFSYLKHLCLYESESNRDGMYTWLTEQALREVYVKPFEICVKDGGATGIMTSYGRIGAVWTGGSEALLTNLVREEWGFKGAFLTDYADYHDFMNGSQMVRAGGDLWMDGWKSDGWFDYGSIDSNAFKAAIRRANKNLIYMWANALATQADYNAKIESGEITDGVAIHTAELELNFRWYIPVVIAVDVIGLGGCGAWMYLVMKKKKTSEAPETPSTQE
ncbi:MAG: glycoside hydrolase family 3 C-terminal domain-containing protein [Erysipelotrichales bacterium]|nr:glycoside hydrolase family 3 C-terminal domain-containing protein [Erysipelotrichales bacterium]